MLPWVVAITLTVVMGVVLLLVRPSIISDRRVSVLATVLTAAGSTMLTDQLPISAWAHRFQLDPLEARTLRLYSLGPDYHPIVALAELQAIPGIRAKASYLRAVLFPDHGYLDALKEGHFGRWRRACRSLLNWRSIK